MSMEQGTLFDERFLGRYAGAIMSDPTIALVELVANAWDAYATKVDIQWPDKTSGVLFSISDNGIGMTPDEFITRWRTLDYDRLAHQGEKALPPLDLANALPRSVYGRNGKGRHAAFFFSSPYRVRTWRDGIESIFTVRQGENNPIEVDQEEVKSRINGHGTEISAIINLQSRISSSEARALLSTRFLTNPEFKVFVDGIEVTFDDVPDECIKMIVVDVPECGEATIIIIDCQKPDKTTRQHGIAWWVNRRLVGQCEWRASDHEKVIDGRTEEAKRYTFIVHADFLVSSITPDWSDFRPDDPIWLKTQSTIQERIRNFIQSLNKDQREKTKGVIRNAHSDVVKKLPRLSREKWNGFLEQITDKCPSLNANQVDQVMGLLANLEISASQYSLLEKLHNLKPDELDECNSILEQWTISTAKIALDEIERRLRVIEEIRIKSENTDTDEVQELQPLFGKALWIFGPQFESIEFTSNRGMTEVIRKLFDKSGTGSRKRPDFVVRPNSSIGCYARPSFDKDFNEDGTDMLVIVELKRPGVSLGSKEKNQVWNYVKELREKAYIKTHTPVFGYLLGSLISPNEDEEQRQGDNVYIRPMLYSTFIGQAQKRMLNLHKHLRDAPFMQSVLSEDESLEHDTDYSSATSDLFTHKESPTLSHAEL